MCSGVGDTTQLVPGSPIRTPWDHSSVDSSPRPIAASHVLHRPLVPRHPPTALSNLTTKMLASTVQFSTNATQPAPPPTPRTGHPHPGGQPDPVASARPAGHLKTQPHPTRTPGPGQWSFSQDPTGCLRPPPTPTAHPAHAPPRWGRTAHVDGRDRPVDSPVSPPTEHPTPTPAATTATTREKPPRGCGLPDRARRPGAA